jgi:cell division topological specificity factor
MMRFLDFFRSSPESASAPVAKERLQVIVAHQRRQSVGVPEYLSRMQQEILKVIRRYANFADDAVEVQVERSNGYEVLELNVTLPDEGIHLPASPRQRQRKRR